MDRVTRIHLSADCYVVAMTESTQITLAETPTDKLSESHFSQQSAVLPDLEDGQFLVQVKYLSIDPTIRGWVAHETYLPKIQEGEVIRSLGAGEVIESRNDSFPPGTRVSGLTGWQDLAIMDSGFRIPEAVSYEDALSVFGMTGLTAYVGVLDIGQPKAGETMVVSGAAGAVGSVAGQIAKARGATVVGVAGTPEKCRWVVEDLGFDACINYREGSIPRQLREACPKGIDVYFDNVGGETLDAVLGQIRDHARVVMCGAIANYDTGKLPPGPANIVNVIPRRARLQGFIVLDHYDRASEATATMARWLSEGRIKTAFTVTEGLASAPDALLGLFTGRNTGKTLVKL